MLQSNFNFQNTYTQLPEAFYTKLSPEQVSAPKVVILNAALATELGLDFSGLTPAEQAQMLSGNILPEGAVPFAQAYAGHQFGNFTILGDGRAIILGEHIKPDGDRVDIQFKGSGRTPYSRRGDGRAVLGPMLREYILSEAMHGLGIPTTRSLAVVSTGDRVVREDWQDGAVLTRVASSHIRVGTFEYAAAYQKIPLLQALLDYTIDRHYPELKDVDDPALAFLHAVMERQAELIAEWMRVGFIHGVMNTDNMVLSGETIDYGPCAFMDFYDPQTVFSSIDYHGRYAYGNQPVMAQWNLARLAETLLPVLHSDTDTAIAIAEEAIEEFEDLFREKWLAMMRRKLGLITAQDDDGGLISELLNWMQRQSVDFTNTFLDISAPHLPQNKLYAASDFQNWYGRWIKRLEQNNEPIEYAYKLMRSANPAVIPRNHRVEQALQAAEDGNVSPLHALLDALKFPYENQEGIKAYQSLPSPEERVYQTFCGT